MIQHSDHSMMQLFPAVSAVKRFCASSIAVFVFSAVSATAESGGPTFYHDVLPILQNHCQSCHRPGEIAPFPLVTYAQARTGGSHARRCGCPQDAALVCRPLLRQVFKRPFAFVEGTRRSCRGSRQVRLLAIRVMPLPGALDRRLEHRRARPGRRNAEAGRAPRRGRRRIHLRDRSHPFQGGKVGADVGAAAFGARSRSSCGGLYSAAGIEAGCAALPWACLSRRQLCMILI